MLSPRPSATATGTQAPGYFRISHARVRPARGEQARFVFTLSTASAVRLTVYDLTGRCAAVVVDESLPAGSHQAIWDGACAGSGSYLVYFEAEGQRARGKIVVIR